MFFGKPTIIIPEALGERSKLTTIAKGQSQIKECCRPEGEKKKKENPGEKGG